MQCQYGYQTGARLRCGLRCMLVQHAGNINNMFISVCVEIFIRSTTIPTRVERNIPHLPYVRIAVLQYLQKTYGLTNTNLRGVGISTADTDVVSVIPVVLIVLVAVAWYSSRWTYHLQGLCRKYTNKISH